MNFQKLFEAANQVITDLDQLIAKDGPSQPLESIKMQMIFIRDNAFQGRNPKNSLENGKKFTYGIISSRELASPDELALKKKIDRVSEILDSVI